LNDEKETLLREFEINSKLNNYLVNQISLRYENGDDPAALWLIPDLYKKIDKATIQQAAKTYLNTNSYVEVMLFPEKK
jgi:zinc protease